MGSIGGVDLLGAVMALNRIVDPRFEVWRAPLLSCGRQLPQLGAFLVLPLAYRCGISGLVPAEMWC